MNLFRFCKIKKRNFNLFSSPSMVRQKSRKTFEELYAPVPPPPTLATHKFDENFFQNSKTNTKCNKAADRAEGHANNASNCRKKGKGVEQKDEKTFINEERLLEKTAKPKKFHCLTSPVRDNKNLMSYIEETEKDEDTEEFFELIKETVEKAVGKTLSDIVNRNFREMSSKIDELREQLNANEAKLEKVQSDMNNKIVHYGEENSRHFRYLCMKSEYDKMFYQHQNIMTSVPVDARPNLANPYPPNFPNATQGNASHLSCQSKGQARPLQKIPPVDMPAPTHCCCHANGCGNSGNGDRSISTKSSEMGMKEVKELLEQLQKFYEDQQPQKKQHGKNSDLPDDSGDEDEEMSSDDSSSPSIEEKLGALGDC